MTRLMHECPMGRHGGSLDNIVALFIVVLVAVMVAMGLLMAPYFVYKFVVHVSTVGLRALETYVLDIGDSEHTVAESPRRESRKTEESSATDVTCRETEVDERTSPLAMPPSESSGMEMQLSEAEPADAEHNCASAREEESQGTECLSAQRDVEQRDSILTLESEASSGEQDKRLTLLEFKASGEEDKLMAASPVSDEVRLVSQVQSQRLRVASEIADSSGHGTDFPGEVFKLDSEESIKCAHWVAISVGAVGIVAAAVFFRRPR